ncbi:MAG: hypothetical protein ACTTID_00290 [Bacillales bacterium]
MKIKRLLCLPMLTTTLLTLTSCVNRKRNYFVKGNFVSIHDSVSYYLEINEITKDRYISSNYINVVEDKISKGTKYFSINFYESSNHGTTSIDLINLQENYPKTNAIPISYCDDNGIVLVPFYPYDISSNNYYLMEYKTFYLYFVSIN